MCQKRVLVTGASRGIGAAIAGLLCEHGYEVIGTTRNPEGITSPIEQVQYIKLDLNNNKTIRSCIERVRDIDVLINNAGQSQIAPAEEYPLDRTKAIFQTNLFGLIQLTQALLPGMRERGNGTIINIGSMTGKFAVPFQSIYVASKFALAGYSWSLRNEVKQFGIKVIVLEPNDIRTDIKADFYINEPSQYRENLNQIKRVRDANMAKAANPQIVAEKVFRILKKKNPRPFYTVGGMGPLMVFLKRLLPDRTVETLVRKNYGLKY